MSKCQVLRKLHMMKHVKIDISMCEPHYVNLFFCEPPPKSMCLTFWHLTSFWQLDIFLTTWHLFWHMGNGKCGQMGIMVNTEDTDGAPWGMGHMGDGAMGHMVNVVMCLIMCNFLNTTWIFTKNLLDIDIHVFYLNIQWYFHNGLFKYKNS